MPISIDASAPLGSRGATPKTPHGAFGVVLTETLGAYSHAPGAWPLCGAMRRDNPGGTPQAPGLGAHVAQALGGEGGAPRFRSAPAV